MFAAGPLVASASAVGVEDENAMWFALTLAAVGACLLLGCAAGSANARVR